MEEKHHDFQTLCPDSRGSYRTTRPARVAPASPEAAADSLDADLDANLDRLVGFHRGAGPEHVSECSTGTVAAGGDGYAGRHASRHQGRHE
ncbi:hypothetical protein [Corynebacterium matruchotii]|uniref:hypothetical protein n=1 Tax=Corynebacterium matruchotii TaxID=43768 RepID=UPI0028D4FC43|nr:hypothetical protein [Corynebacterium matruchotii]